MKLRTVILARHDGKCVLCVDKDAELGPDEVAGEKEVIHDAAAAHALMLAIANKSMACSYCEQYDVCVALDAVIRYADEIMAEWDFDSGEDA